MLWENIIIPCLTSSVHRIDSSPAIVGDLIKGCIPVSFQKYIFRFYYIYIQWLFAHKSIKEYPIFLPASPKAKAGLGVQSLRASDRPSVPKSFHRNSSKTTDPIIMKLGM